MVSLTLWLLSLLGLAVSFLKDRELTRKGLLKGWRALAAILPALVGMTGLVGLMLALLPPDLLRSLFTRHGVAGFALVASVGALVTMPAPIAFPLAGSLRQLGVDLGTLAAFITTLTMVGVVTAPLEAALFGRGFTALRQGLSFALAVAIGLAMGGMLE